MTPAEHYTAAKKWLDRAQQAWENEDGDPMLMSVVAQSAATIAQVHMAAALSPQGQTHPHAPIHEPVPSAPRTCRCEFGWQPECPHHGTDTK